MLKTQEVSVIVSAIDLPLHCPGNNTPVWDLHPRVFLDIAHKGQVSCPYCGTHYKLDPNLVIHDRGH
jgi:uncharacterized Zn-finger protein